MLTDQMSPKLHCVCVPDTPSFLQKYLVGRACEFASQHLRVGAWGRQAEEGLLSLLAPLALD